MDPVSSQKQAVCPLAIDDKESSDQSLGPNHKLNVHSSTSIRWIPSKISENHVSLEQILTCHPELPEGGIWHNVDRSTTIDEHLGQRLAIDIPL